MAFTEKPFPYAVKGVDAIPYIKKEDPTVFSVIIRNKNGNVVCYRGIPNKEGTRLESIEAFWLDLEPSYKEAARKRGRTHDRDEFSLADRTVAYAFRQQRINDRTIHVYMHQMSTQPIIARLEAHGVVNGYAMVGSELHRLQYIHLQDPQGGFSMSKLWSLTTMDFDVHVINSDRVEKIVHFSGSKITGVASKKKAN